MVSGAMFCVNTTQDLGSLTRAAKMSPIFQGSLPLLSVSQVPKRRTKECVRRSYPLVKCATKGSGKRTSKAHEDNKIHRLVLLRNAKAVRDIPKGFPDRDRPLNDKGRQGAVNVSRCEIIVTDQRFFFRILLPVYEV